MPLFIPFYFLNNTIKIWILIIFWYTTSGKILTLESYKLTCLTYKLLPHYLMKHKGDF